jgi:hypothetical protein
MATFDYGTAYDWSDASDFWKSVLDEQTLYYSEPKGMAFGGRSPSRGRYFANAFQDVYGQYLGNIGTSMRAGQAPTTFKEFLETDPWTERYSRLPQSARGTTSLAANPRTRFLYNF